MSIPTCQHCGERMERKVLSTGNFIGLVGALLVLSVGIIMLLIFFPIGIVLILVSLFMGGKRRKVWKCRGCGFVFDRA